MNEFKVRSNTKSVKNNYVVRIQELHEQVWCVTLQFSRHKLFWKWSNPSNFNKNKIHLNLWPTPRLQNIPQPIPSGMKRIFFVDIYLTFCYLLHLYVYFDDCWQRGTLRDADDHEKTLINSFRELADAKTHFQFEDNPAQRDRVDKLRSSILSWILSQNTTRIRGALINYWMLDGPIDIKWPFGI